MSDDKYINRARRLRRQSTDVEHLLWMKLRSSQMGVKFRRQQPIDHYIVDFYCSELDLVIELDGGQHTPEKDAARTRYLEAQGKTILRFWNNDLIENLEGVWIVIKNKVDQMKQNTPHPARLCSPPSPARGEGFSRDCPSSLAAG